MGIGVHYKKFLSELPTIHSGVPPNTTDSPTSINIGISEKFTSENAPV